MNEIVLFSTEKQNVRFTPRDSSDYSRRSIDGSVVGCSSCVGYCQFWDHPGFLTKEQRKEHDCIKKGCHYYLPKPKKKNESKTGDQSKPILSFIEKKVDLNDGVRIIRVERKTVDQYCAKYVTITNSYCFEPLTEAIKTRFEVEIVFERLNYDFDTCAALLCAG